MNLHRELFRRIQKLGQNRGRFPVLCEVRGTEDLLRMLMQKLGKQMHSAVVFNPADAVSGRMVRAPIALNA